MAGFLFTPPKMGTVFFRPCRFWMFGLCMVNFSEFHFRFQAQLSMCSSFPLCICLLFTHFALQDHICALLTYAAIYYTSAFLSILSCQRLNSILLQM